MGTVLKRGRRDEKEIRGSQNSRGAKVMPQVSGPTAGSAANSQIRLSAYRAQRMLGPFLMVSGLVIAIGGCFSDYTPGRVSIALNAGMVPFLFGLLTLTQGYYGERIMELKRRIAELEARDSNAAG